MANQSVSFPIGVERMRRAAEHSASRRLTTARQTSKIPLPSETKPAFPRYPCARFAPFFGQHWLHLGVDLVGSKSLLGDTHVAVRRARRQPAGTSRVAQAFPARPGPGDRARGLRAGGGRPDRHSLRRGRPAVGRRDARLSAWSQAGRGPVVANPPVDRRRRRRSLRNARKSSPTSCCFPPACNRGKAA